MVVKDVMSSAVTAVRADAPLSEAIALLERSPEGVIAVYDQDELLGTVSEHDIAVWLGTPGHDVRSAKVRDVARPQGVISQENLNVRDAAQMMKEQHLTGLVVVRDRQPIGTVSLADLATRGDGGGTQQSNAATQTPVNAATRTQTADRFDTAGQADVAPPTRIFLQPIAAPSILGLCGLGAASLVFGAFVAGWYGNATTPLYIAPFVAIFGGLAQLLAGMWAYRARDGLATAVHGTWGSFWLAYGILYLLVANRSLVAGLIGPALGWWFIPIAAITGVTALAALGRNLGLAITLLLLAAGSAIAAIGLLISSTSWFTVAGYFFMGAAVAALYTAAAMLLEDTFHRVVLPLGSPRMEANVPGRRATHRLEYRFGEPGVRAGQ